MSEFLLVVLIVLGVVTVVGHLIWVMLAAIFRAILGPPDHRPEASIRCPRCGERNLKTSERCRFCGGELRDPVAGELEDLKVFSRQLDRLQAKGLVQKATADLLRTSAQERSRQLAESAAEPKAQAAVAPPRPAPVTAPVVFQEAARGQAPIVAEVVEAAKPAPVSRPAPATEPKAREAVGPQVPSAPRPAVPVKPAAAVQPPAPEPPAAPPQAPAVVEPRMSWTEILESFMEERNIRWGELIGGLLMVSSAVCLVIILRKTLEEHLWLQFSVGVGIVSAFFGAGLYAYHRWKLENTSRALLIVSTLMVPLFFFATTRLSKGEWTLPTQGMEALALGVFFWLVWLAARVLTPEAKWFQVVGTIGSSAAVLLVAALAGHDPAAWRFFAAGLVPVAVFGGAVGGLLLPAAEQKELTEPTANRLFTVLGTAGFAAAVALGLLVTQAAQLSGLPECLNRMSVLLAMAAIPMLACGMRVVQGTSHDDSLAAHRTAGTLIAMLGGAAILAALGMAWPQPAALLTVSGLGVAALGFVALRFGFPILHAGAIACATIAFLIVLHLAAGNVAWVQAADSGPALLTLAISVTSGTSLVGLAVLLALAAWLLASFGLRGHAVQYAGGAAVVSLISLLIVSGHGLAYGGTDAALAMGVFAVDAIALLTLNLLWRRPLASYVGLALVVGATLWALRWQVPEIGQLWATVLALESLALAAIGTVVPRMGTWIHRFVTSELGHVAASEPGRVAPAAPPGRHGPARVSEGSAALGNLLEAFRLPLLRWAEGVGLLALGLAAWKAPLVDRSVGPLITTGCLVAVCLTLAWVYRSAVRTYLGLGILFLGLAHALVLNYPGLVEQPWVAALLGHATIAAMAGLALWAWTQLRPALPAGGEVRRLYIEPLANTAMVSSTLAIPVLLAMPPQQTMWLAAYLFWLTGIWLVAAWTSRSPGWLSAAQVVLTLAVVATTTAWLEQHPWTPGVAADLIDPRSWQVHGIGLALLTLVWSAVRISLRRNSGSQRLLNPGWPAVDRIAAHALIVAQLVLAAQCAWVGCARELGVSSAPVAIIATWSAAFGPHAWCLVGLTALTALLSLWHGWRRAEVVSGLLVAATVPCLVAGGVGGNLATASVLRWGSAVWFVLGVTAIWHRETLKNWCARLATRIDLGWGGAATARGVLVATAAVPVVLLTVLAALLRLGGTLPAQPVAGTFFAEIGPSVSYLVPLALVIGGLVALALRERSAGYAFSAGLVGQLGVVLGYALSVVMQKRAFTVADLVAEIQLATIVAAVWAIVWLVGRRWGDVWHERGAAGFLMRLQLGMGALGNVLLLVPAIGLLALEVPRRSSLYQWTVAAGAWLGWSALALTAGAAAYRQLQLRRPVRPFGAGLVGMAMLGLLACTVCTLWPDAPEWGYRTLMLGWAMYSLFVVLATWWVASIRTLPPPEKGTGTFCRNGPPGASHKRCLSPFPQAIVRAAAAWVSAAGVLAVLLGLKAAWLHHVQEDLLWAAAAIAIASMAGAAMAVWRRQEGWAFVAAPGVNLAASLVVWFCQWHWRPHMAFGDWWILLVQANVIASSAVALVWLAAHKRLYELRALTVRGSPLLAVQTGLGLLGNMLLLIPAVLALAHSPQPSPDWLTDLAAPAGWIALLLATGVAAWYVRQVSLQDLFHMVAGLALGAGVLVACGSPHWNVSLTAKLDPAWLPYHALLAVWAAIGLVVLALGWLGRRWTLAQHAMVGSANPDPTRQLLFPGPAVQQWVTLIGVLTTVLALLWCYADPERPWWSVGGIAAVSLAAGLLAMWMRLPSYVYVSGLLANVAGTVMWLAWDRGNLTTLVETNVICLAAASAVWSLLGLTHRAGVPAPRAFRHRAPFAHLAARAGVVLLGVLVAMLVVLDVSGTPHPSAGDLGWITLAALAVPLLILVWDRSARFALSGIYLVGLLAIGILLDARELDPREFCWTVTWALAGFVLAAAVLGRTLPRLAPVWQALRIPTSGRAWSADGFSTVQWLLAATAAALGVWVSIDFRFDPLALEPMASLPGRMMGPLATLAVLAASALMAGPSGGHLRSTWRHTTLVLGALLLGDIGWAWLSPGLLLPDLHRSVILLVAAMAMAWIAGMVLPRALPRQTEWITAGRRVAAWLAGLAGVAIVVIFGQEVYFHQPQGTAMALPAVALMALVLVGGITACLTFAVWPDRDPLHWSDRRRQAYVYFAEFLLFLICVHLKLTVPKLFAWGIVEKYWMLLVMAAAFCGAGLSELFRRRGLPVLSEPLELTAALLPLAPAIGFWIPTGVPRDIFLAGPKPAVWFLAALFYGVRAATRRSGLSTFLSVLTFSIGFCVLWHQNQIGFFDRPQLWLIPFALAALVAEYLNHDRLTGAQSGGLRYLATSMIYISTSCDMFFIHGFSERLAVPLALLVLSVLGVLAGIALRVRSFLVLGATFLAVSIVSMIYHAAFDLDQKWVLAVCGIALGLATLGLFAMFEKRRNDVLAAMERLKHWQR